MTDSPLLIEAVRAGCNAAFMSHCTFPECAEQNPGCITKASAFIAAIAHVLKAEPTLEMKRALLIHRGYDPDAKEETLDAIGNLDIATMHVFIDAYRAMTAALLKELGLE